MLYLAGQILVLMLAALAIGALLTWVFLLGPIHRRVEEIRRAIPAAPGPPEPELAGGEAVQGHVALRVRGHDPDAAGAEVAEAEVGPSAGGVDTGSAAVTQPSARSRRQQDERQQDEWVVEKAALTARLAAAEQQAAESEQRVAAAERQAAVAGRRVQVLEEALAQAEELAETGAPEVEEPGEAVLPGGAVVPDAEAVQALAAEAAQLRAQLAEAEGRAAKFSSRLAMARTEAEHAQRQVATLTTRLDRHQAEWAAEKVRLLAQMSEAEEPVAVSDRMDADRAKPDLLDVDHVEPDRPDSGYRDSNRADANRPDAPLAREPVAGETATAGHPDTGVGGGDTSPEEDPGDFGSLKVREAQVPELLEEDPAVAGAVPVLTARLVPGMQPDHHSPGAVPLGTSSPGTFPGALPGSVALARLASASGGSGSFPPAAAVQGARQDNLKEIVGIGPVLEARLHALGIVSFRQLADLDEDGVGWLGCVLDGFGDRIVSDDWVGQAGSLYERHHHGRV
ncbi:hypothetical protein [Protofrankia symbiont of Coriaria ruscifolia]|uniref:hypothetical protein n=1 Tax=Protofrankia symbiont of Coriaria ruscifolia TaxID=1306542 RepID=UPI0010410BBF|nr:hypothetical protein [Protofrankia symbiont of Coriaria ruscifolia]